MDVKALFIFEIMGKPAEHIKENLDKLIEQIGKNEGIEIIRKEIHEPKKAENKDKDGKVVVSKDLYITFAEVEIIANMKLILTIVLNMLPAHVEIIEPNEYRFKNFELSSLLTELTVKLHKYDEVAKILMFEKRNLMNSLKEAEDRIKEFESEIKDGGKEIKGEE